MSCDIQKMKELTIEQAKKIQLHVLKCFHELCNRTGLRYSLYAGTLIGALRHRGFIPWDDDVDVAMPREDYEKLLRSFYEIEHPEYLELYDSRTHTGYGRANALGEVSYRKYGCKNLFHVFNIHSTSELHIFYG